MRGVVVAPSKQETKNRYVPCRIALTLVDLVVLELRRWLMFKVDQPLFIDGRSDHVVKAGRAGFDG